MFRTLVFLLWLCSTQAHAHELRIITSFPPTVSDAVALWKSQTSKPMFWSSTRTRSLLSMRSRAATVEASTFSWRRRLKHSSCCLKMGRSSRRLHVASSRRDAVKPFALSSVGWTRRKESAVFMPGTWNDLLKPLYRGKDVMARPARSGSSHLMVEQLQTADGRTDGPIFLSLAGNLSTLTARSLRFQMA